MENKKTPAIFWDFHGTLTMPDSLWAVSMARALGHYGYPVPPEAIAEQLSSGFTWHTPLARYKNATGQAWWEKLFAQWAGLYRRHGIPEKAIRPINTYIRNELLSPENYKVYPDAAAVLQRCVELGFQNHILSNNFPELEAVIVGLGLSRLFGTCTVSAKLGAEKPHPEIFKAARIAAGLPSLCIMVGDNPSADIAGGKNAGMKTALVHAAQDCGADFYGKSLSDLVPFFTLSAGYASANL